MRASCCELTDREHGRRGLDSQSRRIVRAFCEALLSDADAQGRALPPSAAVVDRVVDEYDLLVGAGSVTLRNGMRVLTRVVNRLPVVVLGVATPMTGLTLAERIVYLEGLENARVGLMATAAVALKLPLTMLAYERAPDLGSMGIRGETIVQPRVDDTIPEPAPLPGEPVR